MSPRVVVTFPVQEDQRQAVDRVLEPFGEVGYLASAGEDPGARSALLAGAEVLLSWYVNQEVSQDELAALPDLRLIQLQSAGTDHVDFAALPGQVRVAGNVGAFADPMAEHVLGMALALAKRLPRNHARLAAGTFEITPTLRMRGGTVGILGYGGIGSACAALFRALGMTIWAVNTSGHADGADRASTLDDLPEVLAACDVLVVSLPLTNTTRGLIGAAELAAMKPTAVLINVARGAVIDEDALYEHLAANPEFSAGIDTWWEERSRPFQPRRPFFSLPNVLGSPHNSGTVPGIQTEATATACANIAAFLRGEPARGLQRAADYAR